MTATRKRAAALSRKMKPLSAILTKKNRKHSVADVLEFSTDPPVNPDFSRLTDNKTVSNKCWGSITFLEMNRMESFSFVTGGEFTFPLVDVWHSVTTEASWLQSSGPSLVQRQYFLYICFFVLVSSVSCCLSEFYPVEAKGQLRRSYFVPAQRVQYLGTVIDVQTFKASPSQERIDKLMYVNGPATDSRSLRVAPASTTMLLDIQSRETLHEQRRFVNVWCP